MRYKPFKAYFARVLLHFLSLHYMPFAVMIYYPWVIGSDLPGLRLAVGFVDFQSFLAASRLHRFGAVSASSTVHGLFVPAEKPQLLKASIVVTNFGMILKFQHHFGSRKSRKSRKKVATRKNLAFSSYHLNFNFAQIFL